MHCLWSSEAREANGKLKEVKDKGSGRKPKKSRERLSKKGFI